ncbi:acetate--CoA ligase [Candidatus Entotheonella palauensis]|nr:acetate--CoA ligase [Candidatus Entotheonella palauensis]
MDWIPITKSRNHEGCPPHLQDYQATYRAFSWDTIRRELDGLPEGAGLNMAHEAVDRHADSDRRDELAIRWLGKDGSVRDLTYRDLKEQTNRFANVLSQLGVNKGERVFALAGRIPELYIAALGTLKYTGVFCPLFSAFGPEPIFQRLERGDAKVLVTTQRLYAQKVAHLRDRLPNLQHILLVDAGADVDADRATRLWSLPTCLSGASSAFTIPPTEPEDMALLHFTSGTTGMPKGAIHVHGAVLTHYMTGKYVLDFHPGDVFWCTADPGWVTGTSYGILAPLLHGVTNIIDEAEFDAERWYRILETQRVNIWYTAPTAIRRLMRLNIDPRQNYDFSQLRLIHSVGEPLNPEAVVWGQEKLGLPIHDNWWQTETGGIMIANYPAMPIRPGSMGRPLPGIEAAIVHRIDDTTCEVIDAPGVEGELALKPGWPSMFRGYLHDEARYRKCFVGDWYLSGDLAKRDADGYFWFIGRADDIIKTSGHMVGPFEVESALMEHAAVAEAGVIGKPEPMIGELVKAFVALKPGVEASEALRRELLGFARQRLGPAVAPKQIEFRDTLPKNKAGKIMRRLLKARELGLPEGDLSTLETDT